MMRKFLLTLVAVIVVAAVAVIAQQKINPTDPQPTCAMCPGYYIPESELQAYTQKAIAEKLTDQQVRDVEIGKAHIGIGMVHRGRLDKPAPNSVAEHDHVSEVYHVISGSATLVLGPDIVDRQFRLRSPGRRHGRRRHGRSTEEGDRGDRSRHPSKAGACHGELLVVSTSGRRQRGCRQPASRNRSSPHSSCRSRRAVTRNPRNSETCCNS